MNNNNNNNNINNNDEHLIICTKQNANRLTDKNNIIVELSNQVYVKKSYFTLNPFYQYTMKCNFEQKEVQRKDRDFTFLRENLIKFFPFTVIPPAPSINFTDYIFSEEYFKRKMRDFNRFINAVLENPLLRSHELVEIFLFKPQEEIHAMKPHFKNIQKCDSLKDCRTFSGMFRTDSINNLLSIESINANIDKKIQILNQINSNFKYIRDCFNNLQKYFGIQNELFKQLGNEYKGIDKNFNTLGNLSEYFKLNDVLYKEKAIIYDTKIREFFQYINKELYEIKLFCNEAIYERTKLQNFKVNSQNINTHEMERKELRRRCEVYVFRLNEEFQRIMNIECFRMKNYFRQMSNILQNLLNSEKENSAKIFSLLNSK
jgi:hypothetical protein